MKNYGSLTIHWTTDQAQWQWRCHTKQCQDFFHQATCIQGAGSQRQADGLPRCASTQSLGERGTGVPESLPRDLPTICAADAPRLQVSGTGREAGSAGRLAKGTGSSPQSTSPGREESRVNTAKHMASSQGIPAQRARPESHQESLNHTA